MPFLDIHAKREELRAAQPDCEVRAILGTGTHELPVQGLRELAYVRVGETVLDLEKTWTYLDNQAGTKTKTETLPFVALYTDPDGNDVLLRDISSNHGIWQKDVTIYVGGDWDAKSKTGSRVTSALSVPKASGEAAPPPTGDSSPRVP